MTAAGTNASNPETGDRDVEADVVEQLLSRPDASGQQQVEPGGVPTELARRVLEHAFEVRNG